MSESPDQDRYTVYCPHLEITEGPVTLEEAAYMLRMAAVLQCPADEHTVELIEVSNDE